MSTVDSLVYACATLALLTFAVAIRLYVVRIREMRTRRIHPQSVALSAQRHRLEDSRASDNYNHLFEAPVLFYALCALALAVQHVPVWLAASAWVFVLLRATHSFIQCTYNKVMHRFSVFIASLILLAAMWLVFVISFSTR